MSFLIIQIKGGTGNQLFQAAFAATLSKLYKKNCKFSTENISYHKQKRNLEIYPILKLLLIEENKNFKNRNDIYLDEYDIDHPIFFEKNSPLYKCRQNIFLEGYFTNYRLHNKQVIQTIRSAIKKLDVKTSFLDKNYIVIHLRELQSSRLQNSVDVLSIDYYKLSLEKIFENPDNINIKQAVVFSDMWEDELNSQLIPKLKNLLNEFGVNYISGDLHVNSSLQILNFFYYSKYCIISNSTLSWWGAYLGKGKVFSPVMNLWEPELKIPDNWIQIYANEKILRTHHKKTVFSSTILLTESENIKYFSSRRLKLIRIFRFISTLINSLKFIRFIKIKLKILGLLPVNSYKTFN